MVSSNKQGIEIRGLVKRFGDITALDGVNLVIKHNGIAGLLGPNGAGKTTLISSILGLVEYDAGEILIDGKEHNPASGEFKSKIGVVPQDIALYDNLSGYANLKFFGSLYGMTGSKLNSQTDRLLELTGLKDRAKYRVGTYSGGMKRRLNLACGIIHNPGIVLMDEPTVGIDPQSRNLIYDLVESLANEGMMILYTTHYMDEAERLCKQISIIDMGKIIADGTLDELIEMLGEKDVIELEIRGSLTDEELKQVVSDGSVEMEDEKLVIHTIHGASKLPQIMKDIESKGCRISSTTIRKPNLESVFLHLTGRELRD